MNEPNNQLQRVETGGLTHQSSEHRGIESIIERVNLVQTVLARVMHEGEHYGYLPGQKPKPLKPGQQESEWEKERRKKPMLFKSGAEVLGMTFKLGRRFEKESVDLPNGHREVIMKCMVYALGTGEAIAESHGSCTSMEGKYRFRTENTGRAVPKDYFVSHDKDLIGGPQYSAEKKYSKVSEKSEWVICEKVEHDNPADYYNTILKMAEKRAYVGAILAATACSDMFTQEELEGADVDPAIAPTEAEAPQQSPADPPARATQPPRPKPTPKAAAPKAAPPAHNSEPVSGAGWENVVLHFGKNKGQRLGDLSKNTIAWYANEWAPDPKYKNLNDELLKKAAVCGLREHEAAEKQMADERG